MIKQFITIITLVMVTVGCVSTWKQSTGGSLSKSRQYNLALNTPIGWYQRQFFRTMVFTQHGFSVEHIMLDKKNWGDTLSNGRGISQHLLLHEIPKVILGDLYTFLGVSNLVITSNKITYLDSIPCSVTRYQYAAPNSLEMKGVLYCIPFTNGITVLRYAAEKSHYYEKNYHDFVTMISSVKIDKKKYLPLPGVSSNEM